jgi:hypothetical protein
MSTAPRRLFGRFLVVVTTVAGLAAWQAPVNACPFCAAVALTFSEEIANSQVAVIARLIKLPPKAEGAAAANSVEVPKAQFEFIKVLKGADAVAKTRVIDVVYFGDNPLGTRFLVMGIDPPAINWGTPIAITDRGEEYITKALELPKDDADRLAFFQEYLEDKDEMLARDAYDEFAKVPYSGVIALKPRMKHDQLVEWIKSPQIPVSRRRLYLTMLGVCGTEKDVPMLEELIQSKDRQTRGALDALVAAYLTLKRENGLPLVEELFLKNKDAEYTDTYSTIMALRFHGTEEKIIPRERLLASIRLMLDRPQLADLVIPDLARWEDWSVMDRLVELFKTANEESSWVRVPVINYLRACPLPAAKERIEELAKIDPETVKRANSFFPFAGTAAGAKDSQAKGAASKDGSAKDAGTAGAAKDAGASGATDASDKQPAAGEGRPAPQKAGNSEKPAAKAEPADGKESADATDRQRSAAAAVMPFSKDAAAAPAPPANSLSVFGGVAAAAMLLGCAFWAILKTGGHTETAPRDS